MATSIADLGAEAARQHRDFGAGSLIVCDRLVRIYIAAGIEDTNLRETVQKAVAFGLARGAADRRI